MIYYHSDELYHHGILGQRWGKKNGPPYPLSVKDHSASEKKAGWRKSLDSNGELEEKKKAYKQARREYQKSFNKAYNLSIAAYSPVKSHREANKKRWEDASGKAQKYLDAKQEYKSEKQKIKEYQDINRDLLKKNPNAAVVNPDIASWAKQHKKELLIGAGVVGAAALIAVGAKLFRMSKGRHGTLRDGFEYVSISEEDRDRYRGFLPQMWNANAFGGVKKSFEATLEAKEKIKAPGKKKKASNLWKLL